MDKKIACITDIGNLRKNNEDLGYYAKKPFATLLLICDGMGGHKKGEIAAKIIVDTISKEFTKRKSSFNLSNIKKFSKRVIKKANHEVYKKANESNEYNEMGSTAVFAIVTDEITHIISIGDSRCYILNTENQLQQITTDQTYVEFLYETGRISEEEKINHPQKNLLLNAIGINSELTNIQEITINTKDYNSIMLCSDGLYNMINKEHISELLINKELTTESKAKKMISDALASGGNDNMTVIIMEK